MDCCGEYSSCCSGRQLCLSLSFATDLGLFISYNLVTEVDGTIAMESEPGKGTTVIIRIPIRPKKDLIGDNDSREDFTNSAEAVKKGTA